MILFSSGAGSRVLALFHYKTTQPDSSLASGGPEHKNNPKIELSLLNMQQNIVNGPQR